MVEGEWGQDAGDSLGRLATIYAIDIAFGQLFRQFLFER